MALLRPGYMGRLLVFKSGKVKMALGDMLLDMSQGVARPHHQELISIDPERAEVRRFRVPVVGAFLTRTLTTYAM